MLSIEILCIVITLLSIFVANHYRTKYNYVNITINTCDNEASREAQSLERQNSSQIKKHVQNKKKQEIHQHKIVNQTKKQIIQEKIKDGNDCEDYEKLMNLNSSQPNEKKLVAIAESCTGGLINSYITSNEGCSSYYNGGIIAYNLQTKHDFLSVDKCSAHAVNCVSPDVAEMMAKGVAKLFNTIWGISSTGYIDEYFNHKPIVYYCMYNTKEDKAYHGEITNPDKLDRKQFLLYSSRKIYTIAQKLLKLPEEPWIKPEA